MDRERLITELSSKVIPTDEGQLQIVDTLGRGGNGVAFLCSGETVGEVVAKVYIPPDKRDLDDQSVARFRNEIKLASTIRHPYVIPAIGSGVARVGAYVLPYYLMPHAASTLRSVVGGLLDADRVRSIAQLFLQACLGVSGLHTRGVVHRDLKPENILISREGNAWVADLGIAHIDPNFVSVSLKTMAAERLLNRDYYAPEQRFGSHMDVDVRADIYALGCILYELFAGAPPVRRDSPPVASVNESFSALDPVIDRMTSYDRSARYQHVEAAIVDVALAFGWVTATMRGAREPELTDINEMTRLLRSNNGAKRETGVRLAIGLREAVLPELHELVGHGRREVRNAAATALGKIGDERSIPYLVAGLYGNSQRASTFRPEIDTAAGSLAEYPIERRIEILRGLLEHIRPQQMIEILQGFDSATAFDLVNELHERKLIFLDWGESPFDIMIGIDEAQAWPLVWDEISQLGGWRLARILPRVQVEHQLELTRNWLDSPLGDAWSWDQMVEAIVKIPAPPSDLIPILQGLSNRIDKYPGKAQPQAQLRERVHRALAQAKRRTRATGRPGAVERTDRRTRQVRRSD
jgi:Protein kinase domain/HEAT repeats